MSFIHLHTHSHYSLLDGLPKIDQLLECVKNLGMNAVALTDHGNLYGALEFYQKAKKKEVKPIIGVETYVAPESHLKKRPKIDTKPFHLTLLAKNKEGYLNLLKLITIAYLDGYYYKPRVDKELLAKYSQGLIAMSGCLQGEVPRAIVDGDPTKAENLIREYQKIFGKDNFYLELQDHPNLEHQEVVKKTLMSLSQKTDAPVVATNDAHYLVPSDAEAQDALVCIQTTKMIEQKDRLSMVGENYSLCSTEEMERKFKDYPEAIANTQKITDQCNLELGLGRWCFPKFDLESGQTPEEYLKELARQGIKEKMDSSTPEIEKRLIWELEIISQKGYSTYFLIVADIVNWAKEQGIISTTRGSAAGSLVSYALGITAINPLEYGLPFERFLNPYRPSPPDIDLDFADNRRDEVIEYVKQKYGEDRVAQIGTFGTMMARAAIRDVGRVLGYPYSLCDQVAKMIPFGSQGFHMTIDRAKRENQELGQLYEKDAPVKKLLDLAEKIEGSARHCSVHAAGVVISPTPLVDYVPLQRESGGEKIITQYDMHSVEAAGLIKMDFLGIRNLSILGRAVELVKAIKNVEIDLEKIPLDDKKTYQLLAQGETIGLFQLGGSGMTRYLKELKPTTIFDIMAMVALFRPGPMNSIPEYIRRKNNPKLVKYFDPRMEEYLKESYGIITYQDDVLFTALNIAGYNWEEADKFRKAVGKKIPREMIAQKTKFITGCVKNGLPREKAEELFKLIEPFSGYGFNKSHAASYANIAYQTAYMKANYPTEFMTAVLSAESGDTDKVAEAVAECQDMGIEVLGPDINESRDDFTYVNNKKIRFGLLAIKNLGHDVIKIMVTERKANGSFASLEDFARRVQSRSLNKKSLESLIKAGAMDIFGDRNDLLKQMEQILGYARSSQKMTALGQSSLFGEAPALKLERAKPAEPTSQKQKLIWEKEYLGLYITAHPLEEFKAVLAGVASPLASLKEFSERKKIKTAGIISGVKKIITKAGEPMLFIALDDLSGSAEALVFPSILKKNPRLFEEDKILLIDGRVSHKDNEPKIIIEEADEINQETIADVVRKKPAPAPTPGPTLPHPSLDKGVYINLLNQPPKESVDRLKDILIQSPGQTHVYLVVSQNGQKKKIATSLLIEYNQSVREQVESLLGPNTIKII